MNNRSKNNSIIFLTTLSVYLGLVLVGGAVPSVLAQAATTRNFNVQDEIELKDDLDKKPDDEITSEDVDFPALFAELLDDIRQAVKSEKLSLPLPKEFAAAGDFQIVQSGVGSGGAVGANVSDKSLELILRDAIDKKFYPKAARLADFDKDKYKTVRINLNADADEVWLKVSFGKTKAAKFAEFINRQTAQTLLLIRNEKLGELYQNTEATAENNQVFVITRLPRGSLDKLLKQDAKGEK